MKRQIADKHVAKIKEMLAQNYKDSSIRDIMQHKHRVTITKGNMQSIKRLASYKDVRPDLNHAISATYSNKIATDTKNIKLIKWALAMGYSHEEIMNDLNVSERKLRSIRHGHMPYYSIASKYNSQIEKRFKKKKRTNIDSKMVRAIKKEYIEKEGDVLYSEIAERHKINEATVSTILNLKCYKEAGISFNSKINSIKKKKEAAKASKKKKEIKLKIDKEKQNIQSLQNKKKEIEEKLKESNSKLKNLRATS